MINDTAKPVRMVNAYGKIRLYWEAETKPMNWERFQPQHWDQCGTGIHNFELPAGHWIVQEQDHPRVERHSEEDLQYDVRLRSYYDGFDVTSDAKKAFVYPKMIEYSHCDVLALRQAPLERLAEIVRGRDLANRINNYSNYAFKDPVSDALWEMQQPQHERKKVLELLQTLSEESPELKERIVPVFQRLEKER